METQAQRDERIAADKATMKNLEPLFNVVVRRAERHMQYMSDLRPTYLVHRVDTWTERKINGDLVVWPYKGVELPPNFCNECKTWGTKCGPQVLRDGNGAWRRERRLKAA